MKALSLIALPLACALALADMPAAPPVPVPVEEGEIIETETPQNFEETMRALYHTPLNGILLFVHDKATADAAAPRLAAWLESSEMDGEMLLSEMLLLHYYASDCYGSTALREVFAPHVQGLETEVLQQFRATCLPLIQQVQEHIDELVASFDAVADEASAAKAAAALRAFPESMVAYEMQMQQAVQALNPSMNDVYIMSAITMAHTSPLTDNLLHAFGRICTRCEGSFPELQQAVLTFFGDSMPPEMLERISTPGTFDAAEKTAAALREWLSIASTIHDKASADAAADWLVAKNAELGFRLQDSMTLEHGGFICPCLPRLAIQAEDGNNYLRYASPSFFGSEKLQQQLPTTTVGE